MTDKENKRSELLKKKAKTDSISEVTCMLYVDKLVRSFQKDGYDIDNGDFVIERRVSCENSPMCVKYGDIELPVGMYCVVREWEQNDLSISKTLNQANVVHTLRNLGYISSKEFKDKVIEELEKQNEKEM